VPREPLAGENRTCSFRLGCGRWYAPSPRHLRSLLKCGGWFFVWSFVVLFWSCVVWCCSCHVFVCDLFLFLHAATSRVPVSGRSQLTPLPSCIHQAWPLAFTRYCHHQYCMVYGIQGGGGRWGAVYCAMSVQIVSQKDRLCRWGRGIKG